MLKQITEKEALKRYMDGEDVRVLAPRLADMVCPDWVQYDTEMLSNLLSGLIYLTDEEEKTEIVFDELLSVPDPEEPEPDTEEPESKSSKYGRKNLDEGKIGALHKAGWTNEKIAEEMGTTGVTIGARLKKMKERGEL